jgi:hypothetical protein
MRVRSRLVLGFCGLAMAAPAASTASAQAVQPYSPAPAAVAPSAGGATVIPLQQAPVAQPTSGAVAPVMGASLASPAPAVASHNHHHHGLLGRRHCVECQRAHAKAADGVDVPPPPGYPGGVTLAPGETLVSGPVVVSERVVASSDPNAPGYAVVGGPEVAPGYAVVNGGAPGAEPAPIGVATAGHGAPTDPRMAAAMPRPGAGSYDPSVMQSSVPAAPTPMDGPGHNRPHVISHLLGLPILGHHYQEHQAKKREQHAAVAYGDPNEKVTELPASMVYGRR